MIVGFYVQNPFHYYLYESVINSLVDKNIKCHLILNDRIKNDHEWRNMYYRLIDFIEGIERTDIDAFLISSLKDSGFKYDCVVSPYYSPDLKDLGEKHVRLIYSLAKDEWTYAWWNIFYDKILCFGKYDFNKLNIYNSCEIIGNPKFDNWFLNRIPSREKIIEEYNLTINNNKETFLYVPTYGELSSIDQWKSEIKKVSKELNIIIKLHHGTAYLYSEKNRRKYIEQNFTNILYDDADLLKLLSISDYVITDNSGVIFDAILAEKKILLLNTDYNLKNTNNSIESNVRKKLLNINLGENILDFLQETGNFHKQLYIQEELKKQYNFKSDGFAGERAANVIIKLKSDEPINDNHFLLSLRNKIFDNKI